MVLTIPIAPETEARLRRLADAAGTDVTTYVSQVVEQAAARPALEELLAPLRRQFAEAGTTDEQLMDEIAAAREVYRANQPKPRIPFGYACGLIEIGEDFDAPLPEMEEYTR
jgi:hypothetical protein